MKAECEPQYFGDESKKIIHGDALTELKKLPSESIDLIFADPTLQYRKRFRRYGGILGRSVFSGLAV